VGNAALGKSDFLTLLMAQIKNQDPLNPMDNTDFTAQMAQFSSLEQLLNINNSIQTLANSSSSSGNAQAVMLIGKEIKAQGKSVQVTGGFASNIEFNVTGSATKGVIQIEDSYGNVVREIDLNTLSPGEHKIEWDGKDAQGNPLADGTYTYSIAAEDINGDPIDVNTYTKGVVSGVSFENGVAYVHVGDMKFTMDEILEVQDVRVSDNTSGSATGAGTSSALSYI